MLNLIDLSSLGSLGFVMQGEAAGDRAGTSVSSIGDLNGDGFDDVIVAAPYGDGDGADQGAAYIIFGKAAGLDDLDLAALDPADGFRLTNLTSQHRICVAAAGDVNGDGFDDMMINGFILFGRSDDFASGTVGDYLYPAEGSGGFFVYGEGGFDLFGRSVSSAGDVNGDGFDDVILGAPYNSHGGSDSGEAYVIFGSAQPFPFGMNVLTSDLGFSIGGDSANDQAGRAVDSAGDFNGDGFDDIIVGAPFGSDGYGISGEAYVIFGKAGGFANIDLGALAPGDGFQILAEHGPPARTGWSVSTAGDINGDGFGDIVVGAYNADGSGKAYVLFGRSGGISTIDLENFSPLDGFAILGADAYDNAGFSVAEAGDVNGDGFDDMIVGAPQGDNGGIGAGEAYVIFGKASGFGTIDLAVLSSLDGFVIQGDLAGDMAGYSLSSAGDMDGDGFDDLIVGAPFTGTNMSAAYVIFGQAPTDDVNRTGSVIGQAIRGGAGDDRLDGRGGGDALFGGFGDDELIGGSGDDELDGGEGFDRLVGGSGDDRLDGGAGDDTLRGGSGDNIASYASASAGVTVRLALETRQSTGGSGRDVLLDIANLVGSSFDDSLAGTTGANRLKGAAGHDVLSGQGGADLLLGGDGDDSLNGGTGVDIMEGGLGDDVYLVHDAGDQIIEHAGEGRDQVRAFVDHVLADEVEDLRLFGVAQTGQGNLLGNVIIGSSLSNHLEGLGGNDNLRGLSGDDILFSGDGADTLFGGLGSDNLMGEDDNDTLNGEDGVDGLLGGLGNDILNGGGGADSLAGEDGDDRLNGGIQRDTMTGGTGADRFRFNDGDSAPSRFAADRIMDFSSAENDRIDLALIDANSGVGGDQAFIFLGTGAFTGVAGQLHYVVVAGDSFVEGDLDGDSLADFSIRVEDVTSLVVGDFML